MLVRAGGAFAVVFCFFAGRSSPSACSPLVGSTSTVPCEDLVGVIRKDELKVSDQRSDGTESLLDVEFTYGSVSSPLRNDGAIFRG
jgi:hypothetical protein